MSDRSERLLTAGLALACVAAGAFAIAPRISARDVEIRFEAPPIKVAVSGAVARPGVYELPFRSLAVDAIELAGGMTPAAETSLVDLAAVLGAGDRVHVPDRVTAKAATRVSINSAASETLEGLPGVGPVTAARIVAARPFSRIEDLLRVKGIGRKTLEALRPYIRL